MTTKELLADVNSKTFAFSNLSNNDQYRNLNISATREFDHSVTSKINSTPSVKKNLTNLDDDFSVRHPSQRKPDANLWKKHDDNTKQSDFLTFHDCEEATQERWKKRGSSSNSSTLSLHIAVYESSNESSENYKEFSNHFLTDTPEFPRQQSVKDVSPEIMQYKSSQKVLNPNDASSAKIVDKKSARSSGKEHTKDKKEHETSIFALLFAIPSILFTLFFAIIHKWICIPVICKQFNGLIGISKERLLIKFPLVNERFFFGGLKDIPTTVTSPGNNNNNYETVELTVNRPIWFCWRVWLDRKMGLGEGFMEGDWDCSPSSKALLTLLIRARKDNSTATRSPPKPKTFLSHILSLFGDSIRLFVAKLNYLQTIWRTNTLIQSQKNIREHYDLGNDMFELFLDESMTYSCAIFEEPLPKDITKSDMKLLHDAQMRKYDAICDRLNIKPTDHVLEIGCGWGYCAIRAVKRFGCKWTGLTISEQQFALCKKRIKEAGLEDKIDIKFLDYRKETGVYDKIVSIEMIEAVGHEYFPVYFSTIRDRLRPGGIASLQAIYCFDEVYESMRKSSNFIKKHIFPGGEMPSIGVINNSLPSGLTMLKEYNRIGKHYAVTLDLWNAAWQERRQKILALGYSDRFIRKWEFYFVLCSALFEYGNIDVAQLSLVKEH